MIQGGYKMKKLFFIFLITLLNAQLKLTIHLNQRTFYTHQKIWIKVSLENTGNESILMVPLYYGPPFPFTFKVWEEGKKSLPYEGGSFLLNSYPIDTLNPQQKWEVYRNLLSSFQNSVFIKENEPPHLLPGKYYVQAIFTVCNPASEIITEKQLRTGEVVKVRPYTKKIKRLYNLESNILSFTIISGEGKLDWEEYQRLIRNRKTSPSEYISFVEKYPDSPLAKDAYYEAARRAYTLATLKKNLRDYAIKILKDFALKYPYFHRTKTIPGKIMFLYWENKRKGVSILKELLKKAPSDAVFIRDAEKQIKRYEEIYKQKEEQE